MVEPAIAATPIWRRIIDLVFPPRCGGCEAPGSLWCTTCQASLRPVPPPVCPRCSEPGTQAELCPNCRASPPAFESIRSLALFEGPLRNAIHALKYQGAAALAEPLGDALASFWLRSVAPAQLIIPVPLHAQRQRARGYNQSELLARRVGRTTHLAVRPAALYRTRATASQMTLNAVERKTNVAAAFQGDPQVVRGCAIVLIDDVCTTGATLDACAAALKQAGAECVYGLTLARAP